MAFSIGGGISGAAQGYAAGGPLGAVLGGLGGAFGGSKKKRGPDFGDQLVMQGQALQADIAQKMQTAKDFGIHPLTMLGVQSTSPVSSQASFGGGFSSSDNFGTNLAQAGVDLSRAVNAGNAGTMQKLQERLLLAQIQGQEIDNVSRASMFARSNQPGNPPMSSGLSETIGKIPANSLGILDRMAPFWSIQYDQNGNPMRVYNSGDTDNDFMQMVTTPVTAMDAIHGNFVKPAGKKLANFLRGINRFSRGFNSYRSYYNK